jgi:hypothetical protein
MGEICKNYVNCPIYTGVLKDVNKSATNYKVYYCEGGEKGWLQCKRYIVKEKCGKCPPDLLPNSFRDIESIIISMKGCL